MENREQSRFSLSIKYRQAADRISSGLVPAGATINRLLGDEYWVCYKAYLEEKADNENWDDSQREEIKKTIPELWAESFRRGLKYYDVNPDIYAATIDGVISDSADTTQEIQSALGEVALNNSSGLHPSSLVLCGNFGTGKSGAMIATLREILKLRMAANSQYPNWRYVRYGDFSRQILSLIYDEHYQIGAIPFSQTPILLIDDLMYSTDKTGKTEQAVFEVIDYRVSRKLSTFVSTNIPPTMLRAKSEWEQWGAMMDRLCDSRYSRIINLSGESRRK